MAEIVDVLQTPFDSSAQFTVNLAVDYVPLNQAAGVGPFIFLAGTGQSIFPKGDNLIILSAGYVLPESFVMAAYDNTEPIFGMISPAMTLLVEDAVTGNSTLCWQFGRDGVFRFPMNNYEIAIGTFVNPRTLSRPGPIENAFVLKTYFPTIPLLAVDRPNISMMGVPAALDGKTFHVPVFLKVLHNLSIV